jgi:hypothetical protein
MAFPTDLSAMTATSSQQVAASSNSSDKKLMDDMLSRADLSLQAEQVKTAITFQKCMADLQATLTEQAAKIAMLEKSLVASESARKEAEVVHKAKDKAFLAQIATLTQLVAKKDGALDDIERSIKWFQDAFKGTNICSQYCNLNGSLKDRCSELSVNR